MYISAIVPSDVTWLSNSNNNELLFINLATVPADGILLSRLRKAVSLAAIFMRNLPILCGLVIISLNSCRAIRPFDYLKFSENRVDTFVGEFTKDKNDSNYIKIERQFSSLKVDDNFSEKYELVYKAKMIEGHKVFYALKPKDSIYYDASFGPNHFLFSALIFENKKIYIAPAYDLKD